MAEVERTSMGHERAPRSGWNQRTSPVAGVDVLHEMATRLLDDRISEELGIHTARIVVQVTAVSVDVYVQDMTGEESARIVPILEKYVPERFGWTTTISSVG